MKSKSKSTTSRRKFLLGAGVAGAAAVAMPQVSRAQTVTLKMQGSWPATDVFSEMAQDYCKRVNDMAGNRLKIDYLAGGAIVHPFQVFDGVHGGQIDAAWRPAGGQLKPGQGRRVAGQQRAPFKAGGCFGWAGHCCPFIRVANSQ